MSATTGRIKAVNSLRVDLATAECVAALTAAGIAHLLLKGPTTARWLYRDGVPRGYSDSDILVPPWERARAIDVLAGLGFDDSQRGRPAHECGWVHATVLYRRGLDHADCVDLHHNLSHVPGDGTAVWHVLSRDAEWTTVAGQPVRIPGEGARCLILALHAAQHGKHEEKPLEDLRRGLAIARPEAWTEARRLAQELGVAQAVEVGCLIAGHPGAAGEWSDMPVEMRLRAVGAASGARTLAHLMRMRGAGRLREAARRTVPSRAFIREVYGPQTPLAVGYARRFWSIAARVPRAVRDLRTASAAPPEFYTASPTAKPES
ncbi:hypothetical protein Val02_91720 [Virgisporangium aliadipatigenens]|uniref:Nucleotidyltransferase family protein n=1 Tax=Virgisporangium aliadipatigenens TaxID=741659 RepID=A0A8J4DW97_9ACTN|nr:nucleotidyltransferase family protein [Virgisporangium aliadipatigenens]GIJ52286.1 hypothetical protein Val02_91720 [Virgisporangium aliadipatigenens]